MKRFAIALSLVVVAVLCASRADSQTFKTMIEFTGPKSATSGRQAVGSLTVSGTTLYGMTEDGGNGYGNLFSVGVDGANYQDLLSFTGSAGSASGAFPCGSLTLAGSTFYGMTSGQLYNNGNIFSVGIDGTNYQNLASFTGSSGTAVGVEPLGSLTLGGTRLYGMTTGGSAGGYGNVFSVGIDGTNFQNLLSFTGSSGSARGSQPKGSLTIGGTNLYGMTSGVYPSYYGNLFSVGANGANYQNLVSFTGNGSSGSAASGEFPAGSLTIAGTTLYGMTYGGGSGWGNIFSVGMDGTNYRNLVSFTNSFAPSSGNGPLGSLTLVGNTLYGTTYYGGVNRHGNIFSVGIDGSGFQNLYSFTGGTDGGSPAGDLTLSGGTLFGMAEAGGIGNNGTLFALALPTPEPGTLLLAGSAAAVVVAYRWRRRRKE
jgi:uncharacterized repeat protein (TIGR03803 family)